MFIDKSKITITAKWKIQGKNKKDKPEEHSEIVGTVEIDFGHDLESLDLLFSALDKIYQNDYFEYTLEAKADTL